MCPFQINRSFLKLLHEYLNSTMLHKRLKAAVNGIIGIYKKQNSSMVMGLYFTTQGI